MPENNLPSWFNTEEYANFLAESSILFDIKNDTITPLPESSSMFNHKKIEIQQKFISALYEEAVSSRTPIKAEKSRMRPEVDPSDRERDRKRESRRQDGQTDIMSRLLIVKNVNSNKIEIIIRTDFDRKIHTVVKGKIGKIDKGDVNRRDLTHYSGMENFINTKTSIKLLGKIEGKGKDNDKKSKSNKSQDQSSPQQQNLAMPVPHIRTPVDGKEITNKFSTYPDWDHTGDQLSQLLPAALNSLSGEQPPIEYQQAIDSSRTLGDSIQRIVKELSKDFPEIATMQYVVAEPAYPTGQYWASMGIPESAPNSLLVGTSDQGTAGISIRIGEQIRPTNNGEAGIILNSVIPTIEQTEMMSVFSAFISDFIANLRQMYSEMPMFSPQINTMSSSMGINQGAELIARQKEQKQIISVRQSNLLQEVGDLVESFVNEYLPLKEAFMLEALSGNIKFDRGPGSAQIMLTTNKDGSESKIISLSEDYIKDFCISKDTDLRFKFNKTPNSSGGVFLNLMQKLSQLNEGALDVVSDIDSIKAQFTSPEIFLQTFELALNDVTFKSPLVYSEFYVGESDGLNTINILSGKKQPQQINIPVKTNFDPDGTPEDVIEKGADALLESYLLANDYLAQEVNNGNITHSDAISNLNDQFSLFEKRNYRREYDNYQGKPEQRANRSKRVLARRKMVKKGKVHKGDGKDVNHKDGNPQNNSMSNLESMSASKNRSIHEDHGAGFEGTPELVNRLAQDTPYVSNPVTPCTSCKTYSEIRNNKKNKKKKK